MKPILEIGGWVLAALTLFFRWTNAKINRWGELKEDLGKLKNDGIAKEKRIDKLEARFNSFEKETLNELKEKVNRLEQKSQENEQV